MNAGLALLTILGGGNVLWAHVAAAVGTGVALSGLLASRQMREHVWSRRDPVTAAR